jgi:hypothetical protein
LVSELRGHIFTVFGDWLTQPAEQHAMTAMLRKIVIGGRIFKMCCILNRLIVCPGD